MLAYDPTLRLPPISANRINKRVRDDETNSEKEAIVKRSRTTKLVAVESLDEE